MRFPSTRAFLFALTALLLPNFAAAQETGGRVVLVLSPSTTAPATPPSTGSATPSPTPSTSDSTPPASSPSLATTAPTRSITSACRPTSSPRAPPPSASPSSSTRTTSSSAATTVSDNKISVQAQVLAVNALHLSAPLEDGAELPRLFDAENAIAWKIARQIDPHFSVAEQTFLASPGGVPLPSFENYIRGTNASTSAERLKRLQSAVTDTPTYVAALLALGKEQYAARDYPAAAGHAGQGPRHRPRRARSKLLRRSLALQFNRVRPG